MTRIFVLSDTHFPRHGPKLPPAVLDALHRVDCVIHLGDFADAALAEFLEHHASLHAVHGNVDPPKIRSRFPAEKILTIGDKRIVLVHGHVGGKTALLAARQIAEREKPDAVLFGHSHQPYIGEFAGAILFNPGSPTDKRFQSQATFGLLDVGAKIAPELITVESFDRARRD